MVGQRLRHYRIETKLGSGGMGVVYRARDTHLDRSIALKVLPSSHTSDPDRKSRLAQEARAASALNHPNIITIYDIGSEEADNSRVDFIAMEFVQGKTLDRLIPKKGLKLIDTLKYAIQISDAIATAHANGIIHRDLKPANLMVNDQGLVKVLDFGLAKVEDSWQADAFSPTESVHLAPGPLTEEGTILGTVAYMSPEQAEGKRVDARSDIFSFGSVLYEMVTGTRPFTGNSKLSILANILQKDHPALSESTQTPRELLRIINRCLQKDPQQRWHSMSDVKLALEDVLADVESNRLESASASPVRRWWLWPAAAVLVLITGVAVFSLARNTKPVPISYQRLTFRRGDVYAGRFAPGGQTIVYSAEWDGGPSEIFSTIIGSRESRSLGLPQGRILSVSSTGEMAVLLGAGPVGTLARAPLAGGAPRMILENVLDADWSPDGSNLAVLRKIGGHYRLEYPIGTRIYETDGDPPLSPRVSPKGDLIAFYEHDAEAGDFSVVLVGPNTPKRVLSHGWRGIGYFLSWSPDGDEIWFSATQLSGDPTLRAVTRAGQEGVVGQLPGWMILQDVARDGRVLLTVTTSRIAASYCAPGTNTERDLSWLDASFIAGISDDSKLLLLLEVSYGEGRNTSIYLRQTDGSPAVLLGYGNRPSLSPDGKWVAAIRRDPKGSGLVLLPTGAGENKDLTTQGMHYDSVEWFPGAKQILFTASISGHLARTYIQDVAGGAPKPVTPEDVRGSDVSPDGKSIVTQSGGKYFIYSLDTGQSRPLPGLDTGDRPLRWAADGQHVFLSQPAPDGPKFRWRLYRLDAWTGKKDFLKEIGPVDPVGVQMDSIAMTPDGKSYAYSYQRDVSNLYLVKGLK